MNFYFAAILLGLGFSALALGIFLSLRIFQIPDITTDGSFTLGGAITAVLLSQQMHALLILPVVFICGGFAGMITGWIHTRLKVNALLSGILVMTALYSVNLALMSRSNIPIINLPDIFSLVSFLPGSIQQFTLLLLVVSILWLILSWILKTDFGLAMRATGNNEQMIRSNGVNSHRMKITGLALANGLTAISGYLVAQIQGFADINMGIGIVILGLGSVMIGEIFLNMFKIRSITMHLAGVIGGSILFRIILAFALSLGIDALYLKLIVSVFVLLIVSIPNLRRST